MSNSPILNGWKEIAAFLKVHEETAQEMAKKRGLPVAKVGGRVFASRNAIEAWVVKNSGG